MHDADADGLLDLRVGAVAAGGGCVARAPDGRVVFVRHTLPGERVRARVTSEARSFLRADAVEVLEPSPDRVPPACPLAGAGGCGGCDLQHVALPAQRRWKEALVAGQLVRLAGLDRPVTVEEVPGAPAGLAWRTRVTFAVDTDGRLGLHRHRSHEVVPVVRCPIATDAVNAVAAAPVDWRGTGTVEVVAPPGAPRPVVVLAGRGPTPRPPAGLDVGVVARGRTLRRPGSVTVDVLGLPFTVQAGVFWQVHPSAGAVLTRAVLDGTGVRAGERAADLYAGAGLFTAALARAVGPDGSVVAVERSGAAVADLLGNTAAWPNVEVVRAGVGPGLVAERLRRADVVVLDPARPGAGTAVMAALVGLDRPPRCVAYVACEPAPFARDLRVALDAGWELASLRAFDLFPMTEHVELVGILRPPPAPGP